jgi:hypothetical protein
VWTLDQAAYLTSQNLWPNPNSEQYFNYVTLLLNGDGTNGAQNNTFLDSSTNNFTITRNGNTTQGSFSPYGSNWSNLLGSNNSNYLRIVNNVALNPGTGQFCTEFWYYKISYGAGNGTMICTNVTGGLIITENSTGIALEQRSIGVVLQSSAVLSTGVWNHIAVCRNSSNVTSIFVNGVNVATGTITTDFVSGGTFQIAFQISTFVAEGYYSNLRIIKGSTVYDPTQSTITVPTAPLTAVSGTTLLTCQSNRFVDNSSNNFTILRTGSPSVQRFSPFNPTAPYNTATIGGSGYFDGSGDYLNTASNAAFGFGTGDFTLECWVYPLQANYTWMFDFRTTNPETVPALYSQTGGTYYYVDGAVVISGTQLAINTWSHVAVCRSSGSTKLFINGVQSGSTWADSTNYTDTPFKFSRNENGAVFGTQYAAGIRVIKGTALYTTTFTPPTTPPTNITNTSLLANCTNAGIPDLAMQNNLETVGNAQVSTSVKKYGTGSLKFNGTTDYLYSPNNYAAYLGTGNWTIETWVYLNTLSPANYEVIANYGYEFASQTYQSWLLYINTDNTLHFAYQTGSANTDTSFGVPSISATTWAHLAIVRNGSTITAYVNGTAMSTTINIGTDNIIYRAPPSKFTLGWSGASSFFNGYLDDLRITKGLARYTANFTPPTAALPTY